MPEYMVVLRGDDPERKRVESAERHALMEQYYDWVDRLKAEKRYLGGAPFREGSKLLSGYREWVVISDGPFEKSRDGLCGYFLIAAQNFTDAVEVAKGCPALSRGDTVEVIELES